MFASLGELPSAAWLYQQGPNAEHPKGMVDRLLQLLKQIDTSRGERLDSNPEIEELYNESIGLQGQINALIKKYSDQKGELSCSYWIATVELSLS